MAGKGNKGGGKGGGGNDGGGDSGGINEIKGNRKANELFGSPLEDRILAGGGNDTIYADGNDPTVEGGNDFVWAEDGDDLVYGEGGNDELFGLNGNDTIFGGEGNDEVIGSNGADYLDGGTNDDFLQGGLGADTIIGGDGHDVAAFDDLGGYGDPGDGIVLTADSSAGSYSVTYDNVSGQEETDTLSEVEEAWGSNYDDQMNGGTSSDRFFGLQGFDTLNGGDGDDLLFGGLDDDVLTGGAGADTFVFLRRADGIVQPDGPLPDGVTPEDYMDAGAGDGADIITDFDIASDSILFLSNEEFATNAFVLTPESSENPDFWVLTYQAEPDFFGPSEITIFGLPDHVELADLTIDVDKSPDLNFMLLA